MLIENHYVKATKQNKNLVLHFQYGFRCFIYSIDIRFLLSFCFFLGEQ